MSEEGIESSGVVESDESSGTEEGHQSEHDSREGDSNEEPKEQGPKRYKVKVDGEELEVDEDELKASYSKARAADKRFREAAQLKKQAEHFVSLLKSDPVKVLTDPRLGVDFRQIAEQYLVSQLEEEGLDPKEKELREYKKKLEAYEQQKKDAEARAEAEQRQKLEDHYREDYSSKIIATLEQSGLPKTQHTVKRMAYYMSEGLKRGYDLGPADVVDLVKKDYMEEHKSLLGGLDPEKLIEILGSEKANAIRKYDLEKLKNPRSGTRAVVGKSVRKEIAPKKITHAEWKEKIERMKQGLE